MIDLGKEVSKLVAKRAVLQQGVAALKAEMASAGYAQIRADVRAAKEEKMANNVAEVESLDRAIAALQAADKA